VTDPLEHRQEEILRRDAERLAAERPIEHDLPTKDSERPADDDLWAIEELEAEARRRQTLPSMPITYMQGFWSAVDHLKAVSRDAAEIRSPECPPLLPDVGPER
jgi:hypothetical protein